MTRTAVITGGAGGIGAAIGVRFAAAGWSVVLVDIDDKVTETAQRIADTSGMPVRAALADLSCADGASVVVDSVRSDGRLTALVNNAGITRDAMLSKMTPDQFSTAVAVNLGGPVRLVDALLPFMSDGASIVNVSSKSASGNIGQFNYAVSKAGLLGYTRSLALTLAPRIRVNAIAPAFIATQMTDAIPDEIRASIVSRIPFGRPGQPSEIADVALWLASAESSYVTGQVLAVCGGRSFGV